MKLILFAIIVCMVIVGGGFAGTDYLVTARDDNDIATFKDSTSKQFPAPEAFSAKLKSFLAKKLMYGELDAVQMYKYMQTFRITTPDSNYIFVTEIDEGLRGMQFYLFYFNRKQNLCSDFLNIDGYFMKNNEEGFEDWNGRLVDEPFISFKDIENNGAYDIIFNRRAHNGTWNAVETIVMKISEDVKIEKWFSYYSKELKGIDGEKMIKRTLKKAEGNDLLFGISEYDYKTGRFLQAMTDETVTITNSGK